MFHRQRVAISSHKIRFASTAMPKCSTASVHRRRSTRRSNRCLDNAFFKIVHGFRMCSHRNRYFERRYRCPPATATRPEESCAPRRRRRSSWQHLCWMKPGFPMSSRSAPGHGGTRVVHGRGSREHPITRMRNACLLCQRVSSLTVALPEAACFSLSSAEDNHHSGFGSAQDSARRVFVRAAYAVILARFPAKSPTVVLICASASFMRCKIAYVLRLWCFMYMELLSLSCGDEGSARSLHRVRLG